MVDDGLERRAFKAGEIIFQQGDMGETAYMVEGGKVEIAVGSKRGEVVINVVEPGEMFGEMALLDSSPRMATARAMAKTSCVVLPKLVFDKVLGESHPVLNSVVRTLLSRLRDGGRKTAKGVL